MNISNESIYNLSEEEIVSIELIGDDDTVDITVEDTHCFFANGIYTHNSNGTAPELLTLDSIAASYQKCFPADFIWTLSRTIKEKEQNLGKFFVAKNRNGPDGLIFKVFVDTATSRFEILPNTGDDSHDQNSGNKSYSLKDKFNKYKENR